MAETTSYKCPAYEICDRLGTIKMACLGHPLRDKPKENPTELDYLEEILDMNDQMHACLRSIVLLSSSGISEKS